MDTIGSRIKELRLKLNLTQSALAEKVGMTYVQIGRYEKRGAMPSSDILNKLADALNTTTDYLMNGNTNEKAEASLNNAELLQHFKEVEKMSPEDKKTILNLIDAFIAKRKIQSIL